MSIQRRSLPPFRHNANEPAAISWRRRLSPLSDHGKEHAALFSKEPAALSASTRGACRPRDAQTDSYSVHVTETAARAQIGQRACRLAQTNTTTEREGACRPLRIPAPLGARRPGFQATSHIISTPQSKHHGRARESSKLRAKRTHHAGTRVRQLSPGPLQ